MPAAISFRFTSGHFGAVLTRNYPPCPCVQPHSATSATRASLLSPIHSTPFHVVSFHSGTKLAFPAPTNGSPAVLSTPAEIFNLHEKSID